MSEAQKVETKPEPKPEVETQSADEAPDDKLATIRLPPLAPPPRAHRTGSTPPPPMVQGGHPAPTPVPPAVHTYPSVIVDGGARPAMASHVQPTAHPAQPVAAPAQPRTSWWKALLESSFPPPAMAAPTSERAARRRIGTACAALSLAVVVCALAIGLHGAPPLSPRPPVVDAAIVLSRAIMGLGLLGVGLSLLRIGEHLLLGRVPGDERPRDPS